MNYGMLENDELQNPSSKIILSCTEALRHKCVKSATNTSQSLEQWLLEAIELKLKMNPEFA